MFLGGFEVNAAAKNKTHISPSPDANGNDEREREQQRRLKEEHWNLPPCKTSTRKNRK